MATKNNPGPFDCYAAAAPDEPMFILLARDRHAPCLVWLWAALRQLDGEAAEDDKQKAAEAEACVTAMLEWQHDHGRKSIGLGHAALVAVMKLIQCANAGVKGAPNAATNAEQLMRIFGATTIEGGG